MADTQKLDELAAELASEFDAIRGKWFGKPCIKARDKVFVVLFGRDLAFKLTGEAHSDALKITGAHLFDPRGKGSPMRDWVQIPAAESDTWSRYARLAYEFVTGAGDA